MHLSASRLVDFSSTAGWTAVVYPTNATACPRPMMRRSSAQHGKLQKSWPLPWHHGMSNLTHVSRPFSCAAGLGAGGTDAIGLVLSVHLRASLDNFFSLRCFDFLRHNQIYQWDTPCTNIHSKYIHIYIHCIYISVCVSVLLGFLFFCKELIPTDTLAYIF